MNGSAIPPSGGEPWGPLAGSATGRVAVGRWTLAPDAAGGTLADAAPPDRRTDPSQLQAALAGARPPAEELEATLDEAEDATGRIERAVGLVTSVLEGRADLRSLAAEADALIGLLRRLDRDGRYAEVLRLARSLVVLLTLMMRWASLVHTLRVAMHAAQAIGDLHAEGWVLHELGTLALGADDAQAAVPQLEQAREIRTQLRDERGLETTNHNLELLRSAAFELHEQEQPWYARRRTRNLAIGAGALVIAAVVIAVIASGGSDNSAPVASVGSSTTASSASSSTASTSSSSSGSGTKRTTSQPPPRKPNVTLIVGSPTASAAIAGGTTLTFSGNAGTDPRDGKVLVTIAAVDANQPPAQPPPAGVGGGGGWSTQATLAPGVYSAVATQDYGAQAPAESQTVVFSARSGKLAVRSTTTTTTTGGSTTTITTTTTTSGGVATTG